MATRKKATGSAAAPRSTRSGKGRNRKSGEPKRETERQKQPPEPVVSTQLLQRGRVVVVGLGGIGSIVCTYLTIFLASLAEVGVRLILVDGDSFEERNRSRMDVPALGNKAFAWCQKLTEKFARPGLVIRPVDALVTKDNAAEIILEGDIVLGCVDRHASRKVLNDRCAQLRNVVLISGGNDGVEDGMRGTYGNIQVFRREGGVELNPPLTRFHPELLNPADKVPDLSCVDLAATTAPQILFTNLAAASAMLNAFYRLLRTDITEPMYDEVCFDIVDAKAIPHWLNGGGGHYNVLL